METVYRDLGVLSEPARVRLLALLEDEELGVGELTRILQLPQSTVSRHLKALTVASWVRRRAEGTSAWFRREAPLDPVAQQLWEVVLAAYQQTQQHGEDQLRLQATLSDRTDSASFFGRMSDRWDALRQDLFGDRFLLSAMAALLPADWVVADLGCGTGPAVEVLAGGIGRVIGVDREPAMLAAAAQRLSGLSNVDLRTGGLESLPIADGEIDAATCLLVLHHVADPGAAFTEIRRALRPGGRLVVVDMMAHGRTDWQHTMGHRHLGFSRDSLQEWLGAGGLSLQHFEPLSPEPDVQGPPLFLAVCEARSSLWESR